MGCYAMCLCKENLCHFYTNSYNVVVNIEIITEYGYFVFAYKKLSQIDIFFIISVTVIQQRTRSLLKSVSGLYCIKNCQLFGVCKCII